MKVRIRFSEGEQVRLKDFLDKAIPRVMEIRAHGPHAPEMQTKLDWMVFECRLLANALAASKRLDKKKRLLDLSVKQRIDLEVCIKINERKLAQKKTLVIAHTAGPEIAGNNGSGMRPANWL